MLWLALLVALPSPATLDGQWISPCLAMGKDGRHGTILRLTIAGKRIEAVARTYAHATCDVPTIETRLAATRNRLTIRNGAVDATLTVGDVTMTPEHAEVVAIWNRSRAAKGCGDRDWRLGEPQSVAGEACAPGVTFPKRGARLPVHATLDGETLRLAAPFAGIAAGGDHAVVTLTRAPQ